MPCFLSASRLAPAHVQRLNFQSKCTHKSVVFFENKGLHVFPRGTGGQKQGLLKIASWKHRAKLSSSRGGKGVERRESSEESQETGAVSAKAEVASEHPEAEVCAKCFTGPDVCSQERCSQTCIHRCTATPRGERTSYFIACGGMWLLIRRQKIFLRTETACLNPA